MKTIKTCAAMAAVFLLLLGCAGEVVWYRGNTHAHTVICGHADSSPEVVTQWYHEHGYNFLILSEHNHFINPDSVEMPDNLRDDFILIPGEEISGPLIVHSTAMNIDRVLMPNDSLKEKSLIIQNHVDITREVGGKSILNHPNYQYTVSSSDVTPVTGLYMFELYNGHPYVDNNGDDQHPATEVLWDILLSQGMTLYGVSSDDAHHFETIDSLHSNPGRGWVMVDAPQLSGDAITAAMNAGKFYASNGVILKSCRVNNGKYKIAINETKTLQELRAPELRGKRVETTNPGFLLEFIGPQGEVIASARGLSATFPLKDAPHYVRPRVTYFRNHPAGGSEAFYAWGQPAFTDGRMQSK
jgi:hypothetical protein